MEKSIITNRFNPRSTKTVIIHDGRFHADDMLLSAMAIIAAEKHRNKIEIKRMSKLPEIYDEHTVIGDLGFGVYDHHTDLNGNASLGSRNNTEDHVAAACGLLYRDIKEVLFPGASETKKVFEAFIDIIEHCDNTADNNTFSDSVNFLAPADEIVTPEILMRAINYCKAVVLGFIDSHEKEKSGRLWAVPKICSGIVPGVADKKDTRYWKANNQTKNKYKYVSFGGQSEIKLKSMDTYSLACGALSQHQRQHWREEIEKNDALQIAEMTRREREDWPKAVATMKHRTIELDKYVTYGPHVKDIGALFIVMPSQRGGYTITPLKTNTGKYRFEPTLLTGFTGCSFIANDNRFVFFDTKEHALEAAHACGKTVDKYIDKKGFDAYREIYGGCANGYTGDFYQDLISEDIALNLFAKDTISDLDNLTVGDYRRLQIAVMNNPYLIHSFCVRLCNEGNRMQWKADATVVSVSGLKPETLWTRHRNGGRWDLGLSSYLETRDDDLSTRVKPNR